MTIRANTGVRPYIEYVELVLHSKFSTLSFSLRKGITFLFKFKIIYKKRRKVTYYEKHVVSLH